MFLVYSNGHFFGKILRIMPLSAGAAFGYFGVCLGVSTISVEPVNILPWNCVQMRLVLLWQLLHRKKVFHLIVLSDGSHLGVFLSPFWSKILKCSEEIEEYSYVSHFFWEPFNIFPWNFVQVFLVLLSLFFFFHIILKEIFLCCRPFWGVLGYFFHEILYRCSRYYSGVTTLKRFFTWSCSLLLLRVIWGYILDLLRTVHYFFKKFYAYVLGITLTVTKLKWFFTSCPSLLRAIWGRYFGFILGMFFHVLRKYQYFLWYFVQKLYLILCWSLSKRLWWGIFLLWTFLVNLGAYSWNIMEPFNSSVWIFVHYLLFFWKTE